MARVGKGVQRLVDLWVCSIIGIDTPYHLLIKYHSVSMMYKRIVVAG